MRERKNNLPLLRPVPPVSVDTLNRTHRPIYKVIKEKVNKSTHKEKDIRLNRSCRVGPGGPPPQTKRKKSRSVLEVNS